MKKLPMLGFIVVLCVAGKSMADCATDPVVSGTELTDLIAGNTVCATFGGDRWQEQHRGGPTSGELWDYKKGPSDPIDPTERVGDWQIVPGIPGRQSDFVRYTYLGGSAYNYIVRGSGVLGNPHSFCGAFDGGVDIDNAILFAGQTSCP